MSIRTGVCLAILSVAYAGVLGLGGGEVAIAKASKPLPDVVWRHPDLDRVRPWKIAILPSVSFNSNEMAQMLVDRRWLELYDETGHRWVSARYCAERMNLASRKPDSLYNIVTRQVRNDGRVDSLMGRRLARLFGSDATLSLRIDRFEMLETAAVVSLSASVVDSSGRQLWTIRGQYSYRRPRRTVGADSPKSDPVYISIGGSTKDIGTMVPLASHDPLPAEIQEDKTLQESDLGKALYALLARWSPQLPPAPDSTSGVVRW